MENVAAEGAESNDIATLLKNLFFTDREGWENIYWSINFGFQLAKRSQRQEEALEGRLTSFQTYTPRPKVRYGCVPGEAF